MKQSEFEIEEFFLKDIGIPTITRFEKLLMSKSIFMTLCVDPGPEDPTTTIFTLYLSSTGVTEEVDINNIENRFGIYKTLNRKLVGREATAFGMFLLLKEHDVRIGFSTPEEPVPDYQYLRDYVLSLSSEDKKHGYKAFAPFK